MYRLAQFAVTTVAFALVVSTGCQGCEDPAFDGWNVSSDAGLDAGHEVSRPDSMSAVDTSDSQVDVANGADAVDDTRGEPEGPALDAAVRASCDAAATDAGSGDESCQIQEPGSFGDCGQSIGAVFDGTQCVEAIGCPCSGGDCPSFESIEACAQACGAAGWCQKGRYPVLDFSQQADICAEWRCSMLGVCIEEKDNPEPHLRRLLPQLDVTCEAGPGMCSIGFVPATNCSEGDWCCTITGGAFGHGYHEIFCPMTLLPTVKQGGCIQLD